MGQMRQPVIVSAVRTPIGRFLGGLAPMTASQLGAVTVREVVRRAGIDATKIDAVYIGNVVQAGQGQAPARQAAIHGGVPDCVPAVTVNNICGSGLMAVMFAASAVRAGDGDLYLAGGIESMSNAPYLLPKARSGYRMGDGALIDAVVRDGLWCSFENQHMGVSAEWIAKEFKLERGQLDEYSVESHRKAVAAMKNGKFAAEIIPVDVLQKKGSVRIEADELPRADTNLDALAKLRPAFVPDGMITAGNAPGLSDGASAVMVMEENAAIRAGIKPLARITGYAAGAIQPLKVFACPPIAIRRLLRETGMEIGDFDLIELNEAFSSQVLANVKELGVDLSKVNVNGGAIALGHPIGCSGARILTTLIYALKDRGLKKGLASLCLGGGGAVAMSIEIVP